MTKAQAHQAVARAIVAGKMASPRTLDCVDCGDPAYCYDHRDYAKPYDVEPVCRGCNRRRGPAAGFEKKQRSTRGEYLMVRVSEVEKGQIEALAVAAGYSSVSAYVRDVLLTMRASRQIVPGITSTVRCDA